MLIKSETERPEFAVRQTADRLEFYLLISWPNGAEDRVNLFGYQQDAQHWIDRESKNWLPSRAQRQSRPQSNEVRTSIADRSDCALISRAA